MRSSTSNNNIDIAYDIFTTFADIFYENYCNSEQDDTDARSRDWRKFDNLSLSNVLKQFEDYFSIEEIELLEKLSDDKTTIANIYDKLNEMVSGADYEQ